MARIPFRIGFAALGAVAMLALGNASAQPYPQRPIMLIVPSSAGGPADAAARLIVDRMSAILGQQIIIEAVPGAGGTIGMSRVARAAPDGYTLLIHQNGFAITPALYDKLGFDTAKDFVAVGLVNQSRNYLVGRKTLPAKTFAELVTWMKGPGSPAKLAHPGKGTFGHLQAVTLDRALDLKVNMIPYRGIAPAVNDLLGGHVDLAEVAAAVSGPHIRAGSLIAYAYTGETRKDLPDVPTYGELRLPQLERSFWHALFAPAGTPRPILDRLNAALRETLTDPRVLKSYTDSGVEPFPAAQSSIEAAQTFVKGEIAHYEKVVRENNIKAEP
jgi:tripartite-type tricarboxylate transporter receptor subunit TctC